MRLCLWASLGWLSVAVMVLAGCGQVAPPTSGKPVITASIYPLASLVEQLTGDWAEVDTLLQPGASEHEGDFTPDQVRLLNRAELLVVVGMNLDPWAEQAAEHADKKVPVWRMSDLIGSRADVDPLALPAADEPAAGGTEPRPAADSVPAKREPPPEPVPPNNHLWLDPVLARRFVAALADKLAERYPAHRDSIRAEATRLTADLKRLDEEYRRELANVPQKELITFHNAFDLIARRYGLKIVAHLTDIEATPGGDVTPAHYLEAIKAINQWKLNAVYAEPEFPDAILHGIHSETNVEVLQLDPLGGPQQSGYKTYQDMMRSNLKTLVKGQSRSVEEPGARDLPSPGNLFPDRHDSTTKSHTNPPAQPKHGILDPD